MFKPPRPETVRECLRIGGFQWGSGKLYLADAANCGIKRTSQSNPILEQPFNSVADVFAVDPNHVFIFTLNMSLLPLPIMMPMRLNKTKVGFVDVKINNVSFRDYMQRVLDKEGVFVAEGDAIMLPVFQKVGLLHQRARVTQFVAGIRCLGMYISAPSEEVALRQLVRFFENNLKLELKRRMLFGTDEDVADVLLLALNEARRGLLETTTN